MRSLPTPAETLPAALERAAKHFPDRGVAILDGRGRHQERRSYAELLDGVRTAAGRWAALGVVAGDPLMISLPTSWAFLDAWLGAVWLGALPVAIAPGGAMGTADHQVRKIEALVERFDARFLLASELFGRDATRLGAQQAAERLISPDQLAGLQPARFTAAQPEPDGLAFLQLTSGSAARGDDQPSRGAAQSLRLGSSDRHPTGCADAPVGRIHGFVVTTAPRYGPGRLPTPFDLCRLGPLATAAGHLLGSTEASAGASWPTRQDLRSGAQLWLPALHRASGS